MTLFEGAHRLQAVEHAVPMPGAHEVQIRVAACGVCRTDLHIVDGDLPPLPHPIVPGHEIVGTITRTGPAVSTLQIGQRVGVPWLGFSCGECEYCRMGLENLCERAEFTGYHRAGGYAEFVVADARYAFPLPAGYSDLEAAPLLCAGLIGYRALAMAGAARRIGLYGFGAAAHLMAQVAVARGQAVYAFTRPGDRVAQDFARGFGAVWAGDSDTAAPVTLDAAIILAPVGALVPIALRAIRKGGAVVCGGIHMSDIPSFPYELLWGERRILSVANLTRQDGLDFLALAATHRLHTRVERFQLDEANLALDRLRSGALSGVAVLDIAATR